MDGWDCHVHVFDAAQAPRAGHYRPATRGLEEIEALAAMHEVGHLVLVQPSVYGGDNRLLLDTLARCRSPAGEPRHRGIIVVDEDVPFLGGGAAVPEAGSALDDASMERLHALGVRGLRLNLVSPVGDAGADLDARMAAWAPRLQSRGWHLQWYVRAKQLDTVLALHRRWRVGCVLDHLGGIAVGLERSHPAWSALAGLADLGAWIKLSGWYRLGAERRGADGDAQPYAGVVSQVEGVASRFGDRMVWGSDWPHTGLPPDQLPAYAQTWSPVVSALGAARAASLRRAGGGLYR